MPTAKGTYLGGIRTIVDVRNRCRIDPDTDCWHWKLAKTDSGAPILQLVGRRHYKGRRASLVLTLGRDLLPGHVPVPTCPTRDCVNPAHSFEGTRAQLGEWHRSIGIFRGVLARMAANRRINRERATTKLSPQKAAEVRTSTEPTRDLAKRYGVSERTVLAVKRGDRWAEHARNASVFYMRA